MDPRAETAIAYPLPVSRTLAAAETACSGEESETACHEAVMRLAGALIYYLGAVAVAQYSQALYTGQVEPDPTLNRSLRSLRRVLPGQWLAWAARGLAATPDGPVQGLAEWYTAPGSDEVAKAYEGLRQIMVERLDYNGDYGPKESVSPRLLLEMVDQYRIRRGKAQAEALSPGTDRVVAQALLPGLRAVTGSAPFLAEYQLYAPQQRQLLMGTKPTTTMPPMSAPAEAGATILLYPPGEAPDYTKRPGLQAERLPLFPLDPLLMYLHCGQCGRYRVAALQEIEAGTPACLGLDPDCGHMISPSVIN